MERKNKICCKCGQSKEANLDNFYKHKNSPDKLTYKCKHCHSNDNKKNYIKNKDLVLEKSKIRQKINPEKSRQYSMTTYRRRRASGKQQEYARKKNLAQYGLTEESYQQLVDTQGNCCAICMKKPNGKRDKLYVDHCHTSNNIRGLLCNNCNIALGHFRDSYNILISAINYLKNSEGLPVTEYLPEDHYGRSSYGLVKDPTPEKGREGAK